MNNLYEHQENIIRQDPLRALIALGTGGGKTRVCLELAEGKTLVVCPKQQKLDKTWEKNCDRFGLVVNLTVLSKEEFRRDAGILPRFDTIIFDECHTILGVTPDTRIRKGTPTPKCSQLFEAALSFIKRTNPRRLYLASATPVSKPMQAWAIGKLFGKDWDFFKFRIYFYIERKQGFRTIWLPKNSEKLRQKLADIVKSFGYTGELADWFEVPDQVHETIYVELTEQQLQAIKDLEEGEADPMVRRTKRRTIENGVLYRIGSRAISENEWQMGKETVYFESDKLHKIRELTALYGKCLIFCAYTGQVEQVRIHLESAGKKVWTLTGQTKDRQNVIQDAEKAPSGVVIAQSSISAGYELPSFPCVIFASKSYRYVDYEQALGRVLRANAIKQNFYYHLVVKGGVDEDCHKSIMSGKDFQEKVMENV